MTDSLADVLNSQRASAATLQHAVRYLVAEWSDDLPADDVPDALARAGVKADDIDRIAQDLSTNAQLLDSAVLAVLSYGWGEDRDAIVGAVREAGAKLPVVELTVIVMGVMYGLHVVMSRGRKSQTRTVKRNADGTFEVTETTEWSDPAAPLRAVASALTGQAGSDPEFGDKPAIGGGDGDAPAVSDGGNADTAS